MQSPITDAELISAIDESMMRFLTLQHVNADMPSAEISRKFDVGTVLGVSLMVDIMGPSWGVKVAYNGIVFYCDKEPDGTAYSAYEDDAVPLLPLFLTAIRDVVEGTAVLGVARPCSALSILSQTQIALAAVGPTLDTILAMPCGLTLAKAYDRLKDAVAALLDITSHAIQQSWEVRNHVAHATAIAELMEAVTATHAQLNTATLSVAS